MILNFNNNLTPRDFESLNLLFRQNFNSYPWIEDVFLELKNFFQSASSKKINDHFYTFWYWYNKICWTRLNYFSEEFFIDDIISRQIPLGCLLSEDLWEDLMYYFVYITEDKQLIENIYKKTKNAFINSSAILGYDKNQSPIVVSSLFNRIYQINQRGNDTMEVANLKSDMEIMFAKYNKNDFWQLTGLEYDSNNAMQNFFSLSHFFIGIDEKKIWYIKELFLRSPENILDDKNNTISANNIVGMTSSSVKPNYLDIKKEIESKIDYDKNGQLQDINLAFEELGKLANKYNDSKITELYFYDETEGKFKWNEELLKL